MLPAATTSSLIFIGSGFKFVISRYIGQPVMTAKVICMQTRIDISTDGILRVALKQTVTFVLDQLSWLWNL
jgi:hypothetical protein